MISLILHEIFEGETNLRIVILFFVLYFAKTAFQNIMFCYWLGSPKDFLIGLDSSFIARQKEYLFYKEKEKEKEKERKIER